MVPNGEVALKKHSINPFFSSGMALLGLARRGLLAILAPLTKDNSLPLARSPDVIAGVADDNGMANHQCGRGSG
jgi:hypothetical protein